jgi:LacI family transcriptional regulator
MPGTRQVGIIVDEISSFGRQMIVGLADFAVQHDWMVLRQQDHRNDPRILARLDGVIGQFVADPLLETVRASARYIVNVSGRASVPDLPLVTIDNAACGELAARYFIDRGFTNLAFIQGTTHLYANERRKGFHRVAAQAGIPCTDFSEVGLNSAAISTHNATLARWLFSLPKPVGVLHSDEMQAVRLTHVMHHLGIRVPDEVAILSINDDAYECRLAYPPLSGVQVPGERIGYAAARVLHGLIQGGAPPSQPLFLAPTGITTRRSTEIIPIRDADIRAALQFIEAHYHEPIDTQDVLAQVEIGRRTFERRFRDVRGHTVHEEIRRRRLARARDLLLATTDTLDVIAHAVGYAQRFTFIRLFHDAFAMTPAAFRRQFGARQSCKPTS